MVTDPLIIRNNFLSIMTFLNMKPCNYTMVFKHVTYILLHLYMDREFSANDKMSLLFISLWSGPPDHL